MGTFIRRKGDGDLNYNKYFKDRIFVGKNAYYKDNKNYQCTFYSCARTQELAEVPCFYWNGTSEKADIENPIFNRYGFSNASQWYNETLWSKTTKAKDVKLGDIVVYGIGWGQGCGHVRIIEAIEDEYFICSGGNEDGKGTCKFDIKIKKQDGNPNGTGLLGYIHNPLINNKEIDYKKLYLEAKDKLDKIEKILRG